MSSGVDLKRVVHCSRRTTRSDSLISLSLLPHARTVSEHQSMTRLIYLDRKGQDDEEEDGGSVAR